MTIPEPLGAAFGRRAVEGLKKFSNTTGQCVALCAYISAQLTEDAVENKVALGSLLCNGITTFKYGGPFSLSVSGFWDGHAWLEFPGGIIGEPSLFRTARAAPAHSNLRRNLESHGLLQRGALLISSASALSDYGLKYDCATYLEEAAFKPLVGGLIAFNT